MSVLSDKQLTSLAQMAIDDKFDVFDLVHCINNKNESLNDLDAFTMDYLDSVLEDKSHLDVLKMVDRDHFASSEEFFRITADNKLVSLPNFEAYKELLVNNLERITKEAAKLDHRGIPKKYLDCLHEVGLRKDKKTLKRSLTVDKIKDKTNEMGGR